MGQIYSRVIPLSTVTVAAIRSEDRERDDLLSKDIEGSMDLIISLLRDYEADKTTRGQVYTCTVKETMIRSTGEGQFKAAFPINMFNGCMDINTYVDETMLISIKIDFDNHTALLTGEVPMPEREPDEF